jgi:hypothetical protein
VAPEQTQVRFRGSRASFGTQEEAYEWLLDKFMVVKPALSETECIEINRTSRTRLYLARSPEELWDRSMHLIEEKRYKKMSGGWYANMNLDLETKSGVLRRFARIVQLNEGEDWAWDLIPPMPEAMEL